MADETTGEVLEVQDPDDDLFDEDDEISLGEPLGALV